jgi:NADPH:quinone reductase-like Zn-dependent oxidoreductase
VDEVADPRAPLGDEILVRTAASSINGTDLGLRRGGMRVATVGRMPFTLGFDLSGHGGALRPRRHRVRARGHDHRPCSAHGGGAQAELVPCPAGRRAAAPPPRSDLGDAAGLPPRRPHRPAGAASATPTCTSAPGRHEVPVVGATGGIGSFGVQLGRARGRPTWPRLARRSALAAASALGAHELLAREDGPGGQRRPGGDVVLDTPGTMDGRPQPSPCLQDGGVVVSTRPVSRDALLARLRPRRLPGARRYASVMTAARSADLARLARLVDAGRLRVPVDSVHPLEDSHLAHRRAESSPSGKVVVRTVP